MSGTKSLSNPLGADALTMIRQKGAGSSSMMSLLKFQPKK